MKGQRILWACCLLYDEFRMTIIVSSGNLELNNITIGKQDEMRKNSEEILEIAQVVEFDFRVSAAYC